MKKFQTLKSKIETLITPVLAKHHLKIYEVNNFAEFGNDILQILVEDETNPRKTLDLDFLMQVNEDVSKTLDQLDSAVEGNYFLEVASAGIERQIKTEIEVANSVNDYVYLELNKPKDRLQAFNGTITNYDPTTKQIEITYFVKGQKKKMILTFDEIKMIRYAVKF